VVPGSDFTIELSTSDFNVRNLDFVWVKPGSFVMGVRERRLSEIGFFNCTITKGYWLGAHPVTCSQWNAVMGRSVVLTDELHDRPVANIDWNEAMAFCRSLNDQYLGRGPATVITLPTQSQWEYACKAGSESKFFSGDTLEDLMGAAWCAENSDGSSQPVGRKRPNDWGLYDMLGNVFEWCLDSPSAYPATSAIDWCGGTVGQLAAAKGGAWVTPARDPAFLAGERGELRPTYKSPWVGFRLCATTYSRPQAKLFRWAAGRS